MAFPNVKLQALMESLVAYAVANDWGVEEVEVAFGRAMKPLRAHHERKASVRLAEELTFFQAKGDLDHAMGVYWDSPKMDRLFEALRLRFPRHAKTIKNIDDWAGDASNEREEDLDSDEYVRLACKALNALKRLPWPAAVKVD